MALRIEQLRRFYRQIQALDQEWFVYLNGLNDGDFADQGKQDQQEYFDNFEYMDTLLDAEDLETQMQF